MLRIRAGHGPASTGQHAIKSDFFSSAPSVRSFLPALVQPVSTLWWADDNVFYGEHRFIGSKPAACSKRQALEKGDPRLRPTKPPRWKTDADLIAWLDSLSSWRLYQTVGGICVGDPFIEHFPIER